MDPVADRLERDMGDWVPSGALTLLLRNSRESYLGSRLEDLMVTSDMTSLWHRASQMLMDPSIGSAHSEAMRAKKVWATWQTNSAVQACLTELGAGRFDGGVSVREDGLRQWSEWIVQRTNGAAPEPNGPLPELDWICALRILSPSKIGPWP